MTQEQAMEIVNRLIFGLQRARTASREGTEALAGKVRPKIVDGVLEDLIPWLHGQKAEALLNGLTKVSDRGSITGQELYNFMYIIHNLNPIIAAMAGTLADTTFPKPDMKWFAELGL
jgi:hypothetical protein